MIWILVVVVLFAIGYVLDREIYFYEGVRLGPRVQAWLYDRWSKKYDTGKRESHIVALDLSQGMLEKAASKLSQYPNRIEFLRHQALPLPFPDAAFDAVCALEVLELFPTMEQPLAELTRVLRPGGILLTSRGTEESGRKAKVKSAAAFTSLLERNGLTQIQITKWWKLFDRVIAVKNGMSSPVPSRTLPEVLKCSSCQHISWKKASREWKCENCGNELSITDAGIVLN
jgi:SAM-dependent methyltransferase